jgi:hypothetical protein
MQKSISQTGFLMVVELGAEWPGAVQAELSAQTSARRVLAQEESESPAAFAARVAERLDGLFARGVSLGMVVIACSERVDDAARAARAELARATASALGRGTGGRLLLTACDRNQGHARAALTTLAKELAVAWQSAAIETKLLFADEALASGASREAESAARTNSQRGPGKDGARGFA